MDKNEALSELYTIRAGMSLISQMHDDILGAKKFVDSHISSIDVLENEKNSIQTKIDKLKAECEKAQEIIQVFDNTSMVVGVERKTSKEKTDDHPFGCLIMIVSFFAPILIMLLINGIYYSVFNTELPVWLGIVTAVIAFVLPFVDLIIYQAVAKASDEKEFKIKAKAYIEETKNSISVLEKNIKDNLRERDQISMQIRSAHTKRINLEEKLINIEKKNLEEAQKVYSALKDNLSEFLDLRDWQNIDLIIYYFETGRADTLKEALQLVDKERQMNTLISSIAYATSIISQEIRINMQKISRDIDLILPGWAIK